MRERKGLTNAISQAIDAYDIKNAGGVTVGEIIKSFLVLWRALWRACPKVKPGDKYFVYAPPDFAVRRDDGLLKSATRYCGKQAR